MNEIPRSRSNSHSELTFNMQQKSNLSINCNYNDCFTNENNKTENGFYNASTNNNNSYNQQQNQPNYPGSYNNFSNGQR